jgi:tRNA threonylcarbamoyladenosine biosynthesis protein TsaB
MKLLAIETATRCVGCALWDDSGPVAATLLVAGQRHVEVLLPAIDELCRRAAISVADLTGIAVDTGPGLFTGLRVGLATATTIATARKIAAVGVTSLEALAHPHRRRAGLLATIVDARRGEVYWALYEGDGAALRELRTPAVATPQDVAIELASVAAGATSAGLTHPQVLAVGDGAVRYRELFEPGGEAGARGESTEVGGPGDMWPSPLAVAELGMQRIGGKAFDAGALPAPLYLRQADVRIGWDQLDGRVGGTAPYGAAGPYGATEPKMAR